MCFPSSLFKKRKTTTEKTRPPMNFPSHGAPTIPDYNRPIRLIPSDALTPVAKNPQNRKLPSKSFQPTSPKPSPNPHSSRDRKPSQNSFQPMNPRVRHDTFVIHPVCRRDRPRTNSSTVKPIFGIDEHAAKIRRKAQDIAQVPERPLYPAKNQAHAFPAATGSRKRTPEASGGTAKTPKLRLRSNDLSRFAVSAPSPPIQIPPKHPAREKPSASSTSPSTSRRDRAEVSDHWRHQVPPPQLLSKDHGKLNPGPQVRKPRPIDKISAL
jgi:hypothetical protein